MGLLLAFLFNLANASGFDLCKKYSQDFFIKELNSLVGFSKDRCVDCLTTHFTNSMDFISSADVFDQITKDVDFVSNVPEEGCYARAHLMAIELNRRGLKPVKVFAKGLLRYETESVPKKYVNWSHHIAAGLYVDTPEGKKLIIFDPSTTPRPLALNDWISLITKNSGGSEPAIDIVNPFKYKINDSKKEYWDPKDCEKMQADLKSIRCFGKIRTLYSKKGQNLSLEEAEMDNLLVENELCK